MALNLYRTCVDYWGKGEEQAPIGESLNPRAYELAACGVAQISQARAEIADVFQGCMPVFQDGEELEIQLRDLLRCSEHRRSVARKQRRAVRGHSYTDRARQIVSELAPILA